MLLNDPNQFLIYLINLIILIRRGGRLVLLLPLISIKVTSIHIKQIVLLGISALVVLDPLLRSFVFSFGEGGALVLVWVHSPPTRRTTSNTSIWRLYIEILLLGSLLTDLLFLIPTIFRIMLSAYRLFLWRWLLELRHLTWRLLLFCFLVFAVRIVHFAIPFGTADGLGSFWDIACLRSVRLGDLGSILLWWRILGHSLIP